MLREYVEYAISGVKSKMFNAKTIAVEKILRKYWEIWQHS